MAGAPGEDERAAPPRRGRRRWGAVLLGLGAILVLFLEVVRGTPVGPGDLPRAELIRLLDEPEPTIDSQEDLDRLGSLAHAMVRARGRSPGSFHVLFLPRLDLLEKLHHLVHSPFHDIRRLYCDVWIHSVTTYGTEEPTWADVPTVVVPALKLPLLLFLIDRLRRERGPLGERLGAPFEAVGGMDLHTLPGRARIWDGLLWDAAVDPALATFVERQLGAYVWDAVDATEIRFWRALAPDPTRARVRALMAGEGPLPDPRVHPAQGTRRLRALLASYQAGLGPAGDSPSSGVLLRSAP